jgi:ketosteroid isomerase-like protein
MSQENLEILTRASEALNRGDVDTAMQIYAPDAELRDRGNAPDQPRVVRGARAIRETWLLWSAEFDEFGVEVEEWIDTGDAVIARAHWQGRGKASGVSIDVRQFDLFELSDGKVVRATLGYRTEDEARQAAG